MCSLVIDTGINTIETQLFLSFSIRDRKTKCVRRGTRSEEESTELMAFLTVTNKPQEGVNSTPAPIR